MSSNIIPVYISQVDSEANHTGIVKRTTTHSPEVFMMADSLNYEGQAHPVKRREISLNADMELESITLLVY